MALYLLPTSGVRALKHKWGIGLLKCILAGVSDTPKRDFFLKVKELLSLLSSCDSTHKIVMYQ